MKKSEDNVTEIDKNKAKEVAGARVERESIKTVIGVEEEKAEIEVKQVENGIEITEPAISALEATGDPAAKDFRKEDEQVKKGFKSAFSERDTKIDPLIQNKTVETEPETNKTEMINNLFLEMYPKGDISLSIENKTGEIIKSIKSQIFIIPGALKDPTANYERAYEYVNSFKKDVELANSAGIDLNLDVDLDKFISDLDKKVLELKDKSSKDQDNSAAPHSEEPENKSEININGEVFNFPKEDLSSIELLLSGGGEGKYQTAVATLSKIVNDEKKIPSFYKFLVFLEKPSGNNIRFMMTLIDKKYVIDADLSDIKNGRIGIKSEEFAVNQETPEPATSAETKETQDGSTPEKDEKISKDNVEIMQFLTSIDTKKLSKKDKENVLQTLKDNFKDAYGTDLNEDFIKKYPVFQEALTLLNKIENDVQAMDFEGETTAKPGMETSADETKEMLEANIENIGKKIEKNEKLSIDEESFLFEQIKDVCTKKEADKTDADKNIIMLYYNAFNNNLIKKGEEINSFINQNLEEVVSFNGKSKEEKDEEINERMEKIKASGEALGINIPKSAEEALNLINDLEKKIQEKQEQYFKMEQDIQKIQELDIEDTETARILGDTVSSLLNINKYKLHFEYCKYMLSNLKNGNNDELYETHAEQNIMMNILEESVGNLEVSLERINNNEEEALREWAQWIKDHPGAGLGLLAAAIAAGVLLSPYLAKMLAAEGVKDTAVAVAGPAGKALALAGAKAIGGLASLAGSAGLAGIFLLLTNSENIDSAMESIWGKKIPSWAYWGLKKKGAK